MSFSSMPGPAGSQIPPSPMPAMTQEPGQTTIQPQRVVNERSAVSMPGFLGLLITIVILVVAIVFCVFAGQGVRGAVAFGVIGAVLLVIGILMFTAFSIIQPGDTKVVQFFGNYIGTIRETGLRMTWPLTTKKKVSVKVRNFETREIKVNDAQGNPVMIAAIIVWQVADTAQATFQVEAYQQFVTVQSEAALRHIATIHPYDNAEDGEDTLRGSTDQVAAELAVEVRERVHVAGVNVIETRISSLSYAPEIASAMLQRQQAVAILAARAKIVEGAVSMVESALKRIEDEGLVELDEERKAAMISNLLVVLCSDSRATPTINTGSLYT